VVDNKNRFLYSILPKGDGAVLNISVDPRNSRELKSFFEIFQKKYTKEIDGEIIHNSTYSNLKIYLDENIEKAKNILIPFINNLKQDIQ